MAHTWTESEVAEGVRFPSGALMLEGRLSYPATAEVDGAVVLAGPHPMLGGDMNNNVVREVSARLARAGVASLCFNYRGVGASEGKSALVTGNLVEFWCLSRTADERSYADDLRAAAAELSEMAGDKTNFGLVGYSFGCSLLPGAECPPDCPMVLIAPTVGRHDFAAFERLPNPMLVVAPEGDFATDPKRVEEWFDRLQGPKQLVTGEWDDHFFRGFEEELAETILAFLRAEWEGKACR